MDDDASVTVGVEVIIIILLILANGVFAICEMAIVSSRKSKLVQLSNHD